MFGTDERGQAIQIGAVILFSFLVIAFSLYQATAVPNQNRQVEFDHSQQVQNDMVELRNSIVRAANADENGAASIQLGTSYPARVFALNAGTPGGRFATTERGSISVSANSGPVDVCPTDDETVRASYGPTYNYYSEAPTTYYENTFVFNDYDGEERVETPARLLFGEGTTTNSDNIVNLVAVFGDVSRSSSSRVSLDTFSGTAETTSVTNPTIVLPTAADDASTWATALGYESLSDFEKQPDVTSLSVSGGTATIELSGGYDVVCTEVGLDEAPPGGATTIASPSAGGNNGQPDSSASITSPFASNLSTSDSESQNLSFTLGTDLSDGETVTITLPQKDKRVNYSSVPRPSVSTTGSGGGSAEITTSKKEATVTYTADGADSSGDEITIALDSVDASGKQASGKSYDAVFEAPDGTTTTAMFTVG